MFEKSDSELIRETHDKVIELSAVVLGVKGHGGLIQDISAVRQEVKLAVTDMRLISNKGEQNVAELLDSVSDLEPKVIRLEKTVFGEDGKDGLCETAQLNRIKITTQFKIIALVGTAVVSILITLLGLMINHVIGA